MNTSSTQATQSNTELGVRICRYAVNSFCWGLGLAATWACSGFMLSLIVAVLMSILMYVLAKLLQFIGDMYLSATSYAAIGGHARSAITSVTSLFSRKAIVAAQHGYQIKHKG